MIRNLLYSLCLHILFILIFFFNDTINNAINKKITQINTVDIDVNFLEDNKIKTTKEDVFSNLSLQDKIKLYKLSKEAQDKNVLPTISNTTIKNSERVSGIKNVLDKNTKDNVRYVLYLGPTDYNILLQKQQVEIEKQEMIKQEQIKQQQKEEKDKLENIIASVNVDTVIEKLDKKINSSDIQQKKTNNTEQVVKTENDNKTTKQEQVITTQQNKVDDSMLLNVDINKIFTKEDIKQIKEIIKTEQYNFGLSTREKFSVQNQLVSCYKNAIIQTGKKSVVKTSVTIKLFMDGIINSKEIKIRVIDDKNKFSAEDYDVAINNAKIALAYCNPIRNLPRTKYQGWQNINFVFDIVE